MALTGNELSIANHELDGFSNSFQHIKNQNILQTDCQMHFRLQLEKQVLQK